MTRKYRPFEDLREEYWSSEQLVQLPKEGSEFNVFEKTENQII